MLDAAAHVDAISTPIPHRRRLGDKIGVVTIECVWQTVCAPAEEEVEGGLIAVIAKHQCIMMSKLMQCTGVFGCIRNDNHHSCVEFADPTKSAIWQTFLLCLPYLGFDRHGSCQCKLGCKWNRPKLVQWAEYHRIAVDVNYPIELRHVQQRKFEKHVLQPRA